MIKLIIQLTRILLTIILALLAVSCVKFDGVKGTGNVISENRNVANFTKIEAKTGLNVILEQGNSTVVKVDADENLHQIIKTEVENGTLKIYADKSIYDATSKTVFVKAPHFTSISVSSGANVTSTNQIKEPNLELSTSSGSDLNIAITTDALTCESSSGSNLQVKGVAKKVVASASSGSDLDLDELKAETVFADSSSGSSIQVNATEKLTAEASSGSSIDCISKPAEISKNESSGGSISVK
ncbi:head GIN domain-containing protein [Flavobacterium sp.]|uniref:head GIN domain-containing protein n=1 Tax=Flavobacterium sp. TaxID=239 RepID=UPI003526FF69